jgi:hypothetical protein
MQHALEWHTREEETVTVHVQTSQRVLGICGSFTVPSVLPPRSHRPTPTRLSTDDVLFRSLLSLAVCSGPLFSQQTIINMPSVDQTERGRVFALHESQARNWDGASFWYTTNFVTYGVTDNFEAAVTVYNAGSPTAPNTVVGTGWKGRRALLPAQQWARTAEVHAFAGQMVLTSVRGKGVGLWNYAALSARAPLARTRFVAGVSNGSRQLFKKQTTHAIVSLEQPLPAHLTFVTEWWSGTHDFADLVPGVTWHSGRWIVVAAYKLSNVPGTRTDGVILELGRKF